MQLGCPPPVAEQTAPCIGFGCAMPAHRRAPLHVMWLCHGSLSQSGDTPQRAVAVPCWPVSEHMGTPA